ncbi:MAG: PAS domain S-box protein [Anaerolineaceae bacterium]|nr:PAS domain S-box protein [Anaerolineaceae bacterium]
MSKKEEKLNQSTLHILIIEDDFLDAELEISILEKSGYVCKWERVETRSEFLAQLESSDFDLIISDYNLPTFDGLTALNIVVERNLLIPFILVSGKIGEEFAIESLKAGATDFVMKNHLSRLVPVVQRALREIEDLRARKNAEKALAENEKFLRSVVETATDAIIVIDDKRCIFSWNQSAEKIFGYSASEVQGQSLSLILPKSFQQDHQNGFTHLPSLGRSRINEDSVKLLGRKKDGSEFPVELSLADWQSDKGKYATGIIRDIADRVHDQELLVDYSNKLSIQLKELSLLYDINNLGNERKLSLDEIFKEVVNLIPSAWKYQDITCVRIRSDDTEYTTPGFQETNWKLSSNIIINKEIVGKVEVFYLEERPELDEGPFLENERKLINTISKKFEAIIIHSRAENELKDSQKRLKLALQGGRLGVWDENYKTGEATYDEYWANMLGYSISDLESSIQTWENLVHPDDIGLINNKYLNHRKGDIPFVSVDFRMRAKSGDWRWIHSRGQVVEWDKEGNPLRGMGTHQDITERVEAKLATQESEKKYRRIFNTVGVPIMEEDFSEIKFIINQLKEQGVKDMRAYLDANPEMINTLGGMIQTKDVNQAAIRLFKAKSKEELLGSIKKVFVPETLDMLCDELVAIFDGNTFFECETINQTLHGDLFDTLLSISFPKQTENYDQVLVSLFDISPIKKIEKSLREANSQIEQIIAALPSILVNIGPDNRVANWNNLAEEVFGIQKENIIGQSFFDCGIIWDWDFVKKSFQNCIEQNKKVEIDNLRFTNPKRSDGILGLTITPIGFDEDQGPNILILGADITDRILLESQLSQARKLESLGQLASGIAHEINTPTQFVMNNTQFLEDAFSDILELLGKYNHFLSTSKSESISSDLVKGLESAILEVDLDYLIEEIPLAIQGSLSGLERISRIVRSMKQFSHPGGGEKTLADLNKAIENTINVTRNEWKYTAEMVTNFDQNLPLIPCLLGEFNQVILNLIINASQTIQEKITEGIDQKGKIIIGTHQLDDLVEIRITDTGAGIPEKYQDKIFDPFFTSKDVGKGTGQGLTISFDVIVNKLGGKLFFETEVGTGTTFIIQLPIQPETDLNRKAMDKR